MSTCQLDFVECEFDYNTFLHCTHTGNERKKIQQQQKIRSA